MVFPRSWRAGLDRTTNRCCCEFRCSCCSDLFFSPTASAWRRSSAPMPRHGGRRVLLGCGGRSLKSRLTSIGSGFFIPLFFTASGVAFDLPSLASSSREYRPPFAVRPGLPAHSHRAARHLQKRAREKRSARSRAVFVDYVAARRRDYLSWSSYRPDVAGKPSALVGAAIVTARLFPMLANMVRALWRRPDRTPSSRISRTGSSPGPWDGCPTCSSDRQSSRQKAARRR